ncbi:hypothetical protein BHE74_00004007 [Ensete ventricosum]|nr:hypothetical protein BHE74_00004007 [Ensete ventricosum]
MAIVGGSRSKVLVIGATGRFGQELVKASLAAGHPTYALVREPTFSLADASLLLRSFSASGVTLLKVVLAPFRSVCTLRLNVNLVSISLFGNLVFFEKIPVPVACRLCLLEQDPVFVKESDVATFTICAIDDTRTLNKVLYLRPSGNVYSQNELTEIWEVKTGKKLEKIHVTEEQLLKSIHDKTFVRVVSFQGDPFDDKVSVVCELIRASLKAPHPVKLQDVLKMTLWGAARTPELCSWLKKAEGAESSDGSCDGRE